MFKLQSGPNQGTSADALPKARPASPEPTLFADGPLVETDFGQDLAISEAELDAIFLLLGDDLERLLAS
jgi:hypothetical protein